MDLQVKKVYLLVSKDESKVCIGTFPNGPKFVEINKIAKNNKIRSFNSERKAISFLLNNFTRDGNYWNGTTWIEIHDSREDVLNRYKVKEAQEKIIL